MGRRALTLLGGLSLVLFIAAAVLWPRSYRNQWQGETAAFTLAQRKYEIRSQGGGVTLYEIDRNPWFFGGVATGGKVVPRYNASAIAGISYPLLLALTAVLPILWLIARVRYKPPGPGHCPTCGYDLRATPEKGEALLAKCPECGTLADSILKGERTALSPPSFQNSEFSVPIPPSPPRPSRHPVTMLPIPRRRFSLLGPRPLLIGLAAGFVLVAGSWALSFLGSHGLRLSERYSIYSHRGTVQLHVETATQLRYSAGGVPKVVEVTPQQWFGNRTMPRVSIHLSAWRPYSSGYVMSMQSTALPGGKMLNYGYRLDAAGIAHWVLAVPFAAVLIVLLARERRRRRAIAEGGCRNCGYDLRATPERCPECGEAILNAEC